MRKISIDEIEQTNHENKNKMRSNKAIVTELKREAGKFTQNHSKA